MLAAWSISGAIIAKFEQFRRRRGDSMYAHEVQQ
jgi:hypothetical protein